MEFNPNELKTKYRLNQPQHRRFLTIPTLSLSKRKELPLPSTLKREYHKRVVPSQTASLGISINDVVARFLTPIPRRRIIAITKTITIIIITSPTKVLFELAVKRIPLLHPSYYHLKWTQHYL